MKRVIALVLAVVLLVGMIQITANAEAEGGGQVAVDNGDLSIESTNGFGSLLTSDIEAYQEDQVEKESEFAGYNVVGLTVDSNMATVKYCALEKSILVVCLYTEDGLRLLASGTVTVLPDETVATVAIEGDVSEYFMASAYLVDMYDYSPLCSSYDTPLYTREMQELLSSTVDDYDPDRVLNLDEDKTTNFAVCAENTIIIEQVDGVNTVVSVDDENATYVIENADENITSLQVGNVFVYPYTDSEYLIVKVETITVGGTTVIITGAELEMGEVFSHVKIEGESGTADMSVDDSTVTEGVTYVGLVNEGDMARSFAGGTAYSPMGSVARTIEGGGSVKNAHEFAVEMKEEAESDHLEASLSVKGVLKFQLDVSLNYYVSWSRQYLEFKTEFSATANILVSGKIATKIALGAFGVSPVPGVYIDFTPDLELRFEGKAELGATLSATIGVACDSEVGVKNLSTTPNVGFDVKVEGTVFFGIDLGPSAKILSDKIAGLKLNASVGVELEAQMAYEAFAKDAPSRHSCQKCLKMEVNFEAKLRGEIKFLDAKWLTFGVNVATLTVPLGKRYYSFDHNEFGVGSCPHYEYRITLYVKDELESAVEGAETVTAAGESWGVTNKNGVVVTYVPADIYVIKTMTNNEAVENTITVKEATKITITLGKKAIVSSQLDEGGSAAGSLKDLDSIIGGEIVEVVVAIASGKCGDNLFWTLYSDGFLQIWGSGDMNFSRIYAPWRSYRSLINKVSVGEGVTSIYSSAFANCANLVEVQLPDSIEVIYGSAFNNCTNLRSINFPLNWEQSGYRSVFSGCSSLKSIVVPEGVTMIPSCAFRDAPALESVTLPSTLISIDSYAFANCISLVDVRLPDGVEVIYGSAFRNCTSLSSINFPLNWEQSGYRSVFSGCSSLKSIVVPEGVTIIPSCAFRDAPALESVTLPSTLISIDSSAFANCTSLSDVFFNGTEAQWDEVAVEANNECLTAAVMHYSKEAAVFTSLGGMQTVDDKGAKMIESLTVTRNNRSGTSNENGIETISSLTQSSDNTEANNQYTVKVASFSGLIPGEEYMLLVLMSINTENPLAADNLIYVGQETAEEDGTLIFWYIQRAEIDTFYVIACGPSNQNLRDAIITFPSMVSDGEIHVVGPVVVYAGKTLVENEDYVIWGNVDYTEPGEYICYIRGIYNYTGLVECRYTIYGQGITVCMVNGGAEGELSLKVSLHGTSENDVLFLIAAAYDGKTGRQIGCAIQEVLGTDNLSSISMMVSMGEEYDKVSWKVYVLDRVTLVPYYTAAGDSQ